MKLTRFFAILCLLGAVLTLSAQSTNKAYNGYYDEYEWWSPVYCDGEYVNDVFGVAKVHYVKKIKNDILVWEFNNVNYEATDRFGNPCKYLEHHTTYDWVNGLCTYIYHIIGDKGTKYRGQITIDFSDGWDNVVIIAGDSFCR
jgi:hypothetical protein